VLVLLVVTSCNRTSNTSDAPSGSTLAGAKDEASTGWQPKWDTAADKDKKKKPVLRPTVSFVYQGFHGSPTPQNESENEQDTKNRETFAESFEKEPQCFGLILMKNPRDADFGLQVFKGIDGRTGRWQWVLYRMDTLGMYASGEATSVSPNGMVLVQSVCSSIRDAAFSRGGIVE
jgi:hypothetical protein